MDDISCWVGPVIGEYYGTQRVNGTAPWPGGPGGGKRYGAKIKKKPAKIGILISLNKNFLNLGNTFYRHGPGGMQMAITQGKAERRRTATNILPFLKLLQFFSKVDSSLYWVC